MNKTAYSPMGYCPHCGYHIDPGICPEYDPASTRFRKTPTGHLPTRVYPLDEMKHENLQKQHYWYVP